MVSPFNSSELMVCKEFPFSDFCHLSRSGHGGYTGWEEFDPAAEKPAKTKVKCRDSGLFQKGDYFCSPEYPHYVWQCRNSLNCNSIQPPDGQPSWKMWETWRLTAHEPDLSPVINHKGYTEPTVRQMEALF